MAKNKDSAEIATKLAKLREDYQTAKAQIQALDFMIPGNLQKRSYACGKANCRCKTKGILHGPYYQWTRKVNGKTVNISLDPESADTVKEWIRNNRELRKLRQRMEKISLAALRSKTNLKSI